MIRRATIDDLPSLVEHGQRFFAAAGYQDYGVRCDPLSLADSLLRQVQDPRSVIFLAEREGKVLGGIGGTLESAAYAPGLVVANENYWWVVPEARQGRIGPSLLGAWEAWARGSGAHVVVMYCLTRLDPERVSAWYRHRGYTELERKFVKRIADGALS